MTAVTMFPCQARLRWVIKLNHEKRNEIFQKVDNYFKKNSSGIYTFAEKYGLKVKEYDQYSEAWRLVFKHPNRPWIYKYFCYQAK